MDWLKANGKKPEKIRITSTLIEEYKEFLTDDFLYSDRPLLTTPLNSHKLKTSFNYTRLFYPVILYMINADISGINVCPAHSDGCKKSCLQMSGRNIKGKNRSIMLARLRRTLIFHMNSEYFFDLLIRDIKKMEADASFYNSTIAVRLNGTSDMDYTKHRHKGKTIFEWFPKTIFYDYTKVASRLLKEKPENYHLTFSASENNLNLCYKILRNGLNVAVVFRNELPETWLSHSVIDGDTHDLRFLDPSPCIIGLRAKGLARSDNTGFAVDTIFDQPGLDDIFDAFN